MRYWVRGNGERSGRALRGDGLRGSLDYGKRIIRRISETVDTEQKAQPILTLRA